MAATCAHNSAIILSASSSVRASPDLCPCMRRPSSTALTSPSLPCVLNGGRAAPTWGAPTFLSFPPLFLSLNRGRAPKFQLCGSSSSS
ncbi:MAG: hypothetical protein EOO41_02080 [Methanobacteriota archaeon]|nr:MAG: hypothetical protein EOO41_02080 [Euryarchaeota archaeon]